MKNLSAKEILKTLVSINSVFPNEDQIGKYLYSYLVKLGFNVKKIATDKGRNNIVATFGKSSKYLGFYGHMDTVPRDLKKNNHLRLKIDKNIARGLGAEDMKGGIAGILQAGEYAVRHNLPVKLVFGVDEENISQGAHDLVDSKALDDITFLIVGESGQIKDYKKAFAVCYGRKGRILFEAEVFGKRSHAAEKEKGINAIEKASELVQMLSNMKFVKDKDLGYTTLVVQSIHSEADSFSVPDRCIARFSLLTTPDIKIPKFINQVEKLCKKANINMTLRPFPRKTPYGESYKIDRKDPFFSKMEKKILSKYQFSLDYGDSVADENVFANRLKIPVISLGPIGGGGHTEDEWLNLDSLEIVIEVYKEAIRLYNSK